MLTVILLTTLVLLQALTVEGEPGAVPKVGAPDEPQTSVDAGDAPHPQVKRRAVMGARNNGIHNSNLKGFY